MFEQLLIAEIWSEILRYVTLRDRLNLRQCCHALEKAVALSDLDLNGGQCLIKKNRDGSLTLKFGGYRFKLKNNLQAFEQLLRLRKRLFARAYVPTVKTHGALFRTIPVKYIELLLDGCQFTELLIPIRRRELTRALADFVRLHEKKVVLIAHDFDLDVLLSFKRLKELHIRMFDFEIPEDTFLTFIQRRHVVLEFPTTITSGQMIFDAVESILAYDDGRMKLDFTSTFDAMTQFIRTCKEAGNPLAYKDEAAQAMELTALYREKVLISVTPAIIRSDGYLVVEVVKEL